MKRLWIKKEDLKLKKQMIMEKLKKKKDLSVFENIYFDTLKICKIKIILISMKLILIFFFDFQQALDSLLFLKKFHDKDWLNRD